jgi:hypothetical protein
MSLIKNCLYLHEFLRPRDTHQDTPIEAIIDTSTTTPTP